MKRLTSSTLTIVLAAGLLVLGGIGVTMAATGGTFLLGKSNSAGATTSLTNSAGTALSLNSKAGTAPLKVNRTTKVSHLNADLLDGLDSSALQRRAVGSCATGTSSVGLTGALSCATPVTAFTTSGAHTYTVPAGVTQVQVRMWGAGGGGSFNSNNIQFPGSFSGSGGGQGSYVEVLVPVVAGQVLTATLGAGGNGEAFNNSQPIPATDGGSSVLSRAATTNATAPGGKAATSPTGSCGTANVGGAGGKAGSVVAPAIGLTTTPGLQGEGGIIRCASESPVGGAGGGSGFAGAGGNGPSYNGNFDAGGGGFAGAVVFTPVG